MPWQCVRHSPRDVCPMFIHLMPANADRCELLRPTADDCGAPLPAAPRRSQWRATAVRCGLMLSAGAPPTVCCCGPTVSRMLPPRLCNVSRCIDACHGAPFTRLHMAAQSEPAVAHCALMASNAAQCLPMRTATCGRMMCPTLCDPFLAHTHTRTHNAARRCPMTSTAGYVGPTATAAGRRCPRLATDATHAKPNAWRLRRGRGTTRQRIACMPLIRASWV
jgi:hypothetical protein